MPHDPPLANAIKRAIDLAFEELRSGGVIFRSRQAEGECAPAAGIPSDVIREPTAAYRPDPRTWQIGFASGFTKELERLDRTNKARTLEAIARIATGPMDAHGDTIKRLVGEKRNLWRYRIGELRLIYSPDPDTKQVLLVTIAPRSQVYG